MTKLWNKIDELQQEGGITYKYNAEHAKYNTKVTGKLV